MKGILFMCVANSARSQIAEGLARALLPSGVSVWSAGSKPCAVRPEAIEVMREIGIDISAQYSKAVDVVPAGEIDVVVTLCSEEVCPIFFGNVKRLDWAMPDPAGQGASGEERLSAFRRTRDDIRSRILDLAMAEGLPVQGNR